MMTLAQILTQSFSVSQADLDKAAAYQQKYGGRLEQILISLGSLSEESLPNLYSQLFALPLLDIKDWQDTELPTVEASLLAELLAVSWVPLQYADDNTLVIAVKYPLELIAQEALLNSGITAELHVAADSDISVLAGRFNHNTAAPDDVFMGDEEDRLRELASEAPTVNLLNSLITRALRQGASDMHLEPFQGYYRARYRIDGVLHEVERLAPRMQLPIVTRLKILSGMDIAERRRPQDGKIAMRIANQDLDIRVSALPLNDGESVVMRFLRQESVDYSMDMLGLARDIQQFVNQDLKKTSGVILLTGPTGSGKTTTLYSFLNELNNEDVKIITLEDPVEYQLEGVNQVQVNKDIGFDFAAGLRSIVRQDPDIIMLGEIRDMETAHIAMQSALTGHLVFSTVHTNDAASAYTRLLDLGVDEYLLNAALVSIIAQRLARRVCPHCATPDPQQDEYIKLYSLDELANKYSVPAISLVHGAGCEHCAGTGYRGRVAVNEYLRCDEGLKAIPKDANFLSNARKYASDNGSRSLLEDGFYKALLGQTSIEEVLRVAG